MNELRGLTGSISIQMKCSKTAHKGPTNAEPGSSISIAALILRLHYQPRQCRDSQGSCIFCYLLQNILISAGAVRWTPGPFGRPGRARVFRLWSRTQKRVFLPHLNQSFITGQFLPSVIKATGTFPGMYYSSGHVYILRRVIISSSRYFMVKIFYPRWLLTAEKHQTVSPLFSV